MTYSDGKGEDPDSNLVGEVPCAARGQQRVKPLYPWAHVEEHVVADQMRPGRPRAPPATPRQGVTP